MASAQVMSNVAVSSRKQKDLEAGRRRLEEFRKKKAGKKIALASEPPISTSTTSESLVLENGNVLHLNSKDVGTSGRTADVVGGPLVEIAKDTDLAHSSCHGNGVDSLTHTFSDSTVLENNSISFGLPQTQSKEIEHLRNDASVLHNSSYSQQNENNFGSYGLSSGERQSAHGTSSNLSNYSGLLGIEESQLEKPMSSLGTTKATNSFSYGVDSLSSAQSGGFSSKSHSDFGQSIHEDAKINNYMEGTDQKMNHHIDDFASSFNEPQSSQSSQRLFNVDIQESSGQDLLGTSEAYIKRSRPSFLDSLNISKASFSNSVSHSQPQKRESLGGPNVVAAYSSPNLFGHIGTLDSQLKLGNTKSHADYLVDEYQSRNTFMMDGKVDLLPSKPNEDFVALEQHIEDLTQEKFSLQRALEASKILAESLAAENSSLTESYNQQGIVVAQLKSDIERLQAEIKELLSEFESMRVQYTNAQLECNAADERAKLLASEVIVLEEKALRLRSSELKLEKELERSNADITSCKKKISSLERERQDMRQTIDALQEEKKLLLAKLRKASASGRSFDSNERRSKKNVSTSTDNFDDGISSSVRGDEIDTISITSTHDAPDPSVASASEADLLSILQTNGNFGFDASSVMIPPDQVQMIENINTLLFELMAEKEELTAALAKEISASAKFKDLNKELSHKLEIQTQRLELLTAQTMANGNTVARQPVDTHVVQENAVVYADEGDEVVERVLGWIMKLFPDGPSKRRTGKRL